MICCAHGLSFYLLLKELQAHSWENIFTGFEENEHATGWQALAFSQYFFFVNTFGAFHGSSYLAKAKENIRFYCFMDHVAALKMLSYDLSQ